MNKNIEKEFKVLVTKQQFDFLLKSYPSVVFKKQVNTYYDTADRKIEKLRGAMRIREKDDFIFTLKIPNNEDLLEYECNVEKNDVTALDNSDIKDLLAGYNIDGPFFVLTTLKTHRAVYETEFAELCFDISTYNGVTDYELEYEYKKDHDGNLVFQTILDKIGIVYHSNCDSKIKRAMDSL